MSITVAGRELEVWTCPRCGMRIFPVSEKSAHLDRHKKLDKKHREHVDRIREGLRKVLHRNI